MTFCLALGFDSGSGSLCVVSSRTRRSSLPLPVQSSLHQLRVSLHFSNQDLGSSDDSFSDRWSRRGRHAFAMIRSFKFGDIVRLIWFMAMHSVPPQLVTLYSVMPFYSFKFPFTSHTRLIQ